MNNKELITQLSKAKQLILKGWCQGAFTTVINDVKCYCIRGACMETGDSRYASLGAQAILEQVLISLTEDLSPIMGLAEWNDTPGRSKYEVAALFDHAIVGLTQDTKPQP